MTPWLQILSHYPVETAGLIMAPRGFGNLATIMLSGRLSGKIDPRLMVAGMVGMVWMTIGAFIMAKMINFEI